MRLILTVYLYYVNSNPMSRHYHTRQNLCIPSNVDVPTVALGMAILHTDIHGRGRILGLHTEIVPVHVIHVRLASRLLTSVCPIESIQDSDVPLNQLRLVHRIVAISVAL